MFAESSSVSDTALVNRMNENFSKILQENADSAKYYIEGALSIARKSDYKKGIASSLNNLGLALNEKREYNKALEHYMEAVAVFEEIKCYDKLSITLANIGNFFFAQSNYSRALEYFKSSLFYARAVKDEKRIASLLGNIGIIYYNMGIYPQALDYYIQALNIRQKLGDKKGIAYVYNNIGSIYDEQKNYVKSLEQYNKSLEIRRELDDKKGIASCLINIGVTYSNTGNQEKALECFNESYAIAQKIDFKNGVAFALNNIGDIFHKKGQYDKSLECYLKTMDIYNTIKDDKGLTVAYINIGNINKEKGNFESALKFYRQAIEIAKNAGFRDLVRNVYRKLAELYSGEKKFRQAFEYFNMYAALNDSILNQSAYKQIADMQVKYEVARKEQEIQLLRKEKELQGLQVKQKQYLIYWLLGIFACIIIVAWERFNSYRQKQHNRQLLMQQKTDRMVLESERKMLAKIIETEENERKRFAKDLHDGLGPLLSSIKLYVNELSIDRNSNDAELVKYTSELIDEAIGSTRLLANNLMPTILEDYGLIEAVKLFSDKISYTGIINIIINNNDAPVISNKTTQIIIYRVILELINNTLRHARANSITIDFSGTHDKFCIKYTDNGIGFDVEATMKQVDKGLGLSNIIQRINSIGGACKFTSKPGQGVTVEISVPCNGKSLKN
ncbi:MAG: sensor histidine kinase [Bacteroidia bacterium]|nr:sensor histidine kinase [Bacteroidia bacterium]